MIFFNAADKITVHHSDNHVFYISSNYVHGNAGVTADTGWESISAPADGDHDGMPDAWETPCGLNPADAADRNGDRDSDGYTNLEEYINWLCTPQAKADIDRSCVIGMDDFAILSSSWMTHYGDADWNSLCDIAVPANDAVDITDLMVLVDNWLW